MTDGSPPADGSRSGGRPVPEAGMQYRDGTPVFTEEGNRIGAVAGVVVDPKTDEIAGVLIDTGHLAKRMRVLDPGTVAEATADRMVLVAGTGADDLAVFEERHFAPLDGTSRERISPGTRRAMVEYRPFEVTGGYPAGLVASFDRVRVTDRNIPSGDVAIETGIGVTSADGRNLGKVVEVLTADGAVTGFVVEKGVFLKAERAIPNGWVRSLGESAVRLGVTAETVDGLPIYTG